MTLTAVTDSRPWLLVGWTMLHLLWVGGLLGLAAAVLRRALRGARPEVRYGIAMLGLAALAVAPMVIALLLFMASRPTDPRNLLAESPGLSRTEATALPILLRESSPTSRPISVPIRWEDRATSSANPTLGSSLLVAAARGLPGLWLVGAPATFALLATGFIGAERLRRQSRLVTNGDLLERCRRLASALGIGRPVALGVCDRLLTPVLLGVVRPMILLPSSALTGWSPEQVEMALLHELAHVRRFDNLVNLVQRTIEAVLFFHPVVWWVSGWVRLEREHCCDRVVIAHTGQARPYAELLAALAVHSAPRGRAAVAMAEAPIVDRIRRVLNLEDQPMRLSRAFIAFVAGLLVAPAALITSQAGPPDQEKIHAPAASADRAGPAKPVDARMESLFREALQGAKAIVGRSSRVQAMIAIAEAQSRAGDRDAASQTFAEAVAMTKEIRFGDSRDFPHLLLQVAKAQDKAGFRKEVIASLRMLLQIAETPVQREFEDGQFDISQVNKPNLYQNLVSAQAELGDEEGVRHTLEKGQYFLRTANDPFIRTSVSRSLISLQARSRDLIGAFRMLDDPDLFQDQNAARDRHFALLDIVSQIQAGDDNAAALILKKARQAMEVNNGEVRKTWTAEGMNLSQNYDLRVIAMAETRLGRVAEAVKTVRAIDPHRVKPIRVDGGGVRGTIAMTKVKTSISESPSGRARKPPPPLAPEAEAIQTELYYKAGTLASIGEAQARTGDQAGARESTEEIVHIAERIHDLDRKQELFMRAFVIPLLGHDFAGALRLAESTQPDAWGQNYLVIAGAQLRANDKAGAQATLDRALRRLKALLDATKSDDLVAPSQTRDHRLGFLGIIQARQGDLQGGIASVERIASGKIKPQALRRLAYDRASLNDLDGAIEVVNRIGPPEERAMALGSVLSGLPRSVAAGSKPVETTPR